MPHMDAEMYHNVQVRAAFQELCWWLQQEPLEGPIGFHGEPGASTRRRATVSLMRGPVPRAQRTGGAVETEPSDLGEEVELSG